MSQLTFDCPYGECLAKNAAFTARGCFVIEPLSDVYIVPMQCGVCGNGIIVKLKGYQVTNWAQNQRAFSDQIKIIDIQPNKQKSETPEFLPENVSNYFSQAKGSSEARLWDAAGAMYRKALDVSLNSLNPGEKGTIYNRIVALPESAGVTSAMKKWAHAIRRLGNDAAHDDDPFTEEEARMLETFTQMFLTYAFSLPGLLTRYQSGTFSREI